MRIILLDAISYAAPDSAFKTGEVRTKGTGRNRTKEDVWGTYAYFRSNGTDGLEKDKIYQVELNWTSPPGTDTADVWLNTNASPDSMAYREMQHLLDIHIKSSAWWAIRPKVNGKHTCDSSEDCRVLCQYPISDEFLDMGQHEDMRAIEAYFTYYG